MRRALLIVAVLAGLAGVALAAEGPYQTSEYTLTKKRPAHPTAEHFQFDYVNP